MSTRSNIAVKVKPEDYDKVNEKCQFNVLDYKVSDETPYLQIYVHWDGYPSHMLNELQENWNSYDKALGIVMEGDTSYIDKGCQEPYTARGDSYDEVKPRIYKEPMYAQAYLYVFENDEWDIK